MTILKMCTQATLLLVSMAVQAEGGGNSAAYGSGKEAGARIPSSIETEHKALHEQLHRVRQAGGKTGQAAADVEKLLKPHFDKEEQFALPPLGMLPGLAAGRVPGDSADIIRMTDQLKKELPQMLSEHRQVVAALGRLQAAAQAENKPEGIAFARALSDHAAQEEQVLYPAALLVGAYLKQVGN